LPPIDGRVIGSSLKKDLSSTMSTVLQKKLNGKLDEIGDMQRKKKLEEVTNPVNNEENNDKPINENPVVVMKNDIPKPP
jgi:hypothetical protein